MSGSRLKGRDAIIPRYGSERSFVSRTLYSWLTLTILYLAPWPLLVIFTGAPGVSIEDTPAAWFQLRFLAPALVAILAAWLWRLSPVPTDTINAARSLALFRQGRIWPQVLIILLGTIAALSGFMLVEHPAGAVKLMTLTLAEALVIQIVNSGYLHGAFDLLLDEFPAALAATGLYALTFGIRAALVAAFPQPTGGGDLTAAILAGLVVGAAVGGVSSWLRTRSASLLPGILALWLAFLVLGLGEFYAG